ncbi:hypothetical protein ACOZ4N_15920 [Halorientalis pallida]|uniref:hypothetical protein n=1 Tax=Halorientalis pallida TaxID=2479928 RepID=UPI003C6FD922
MVSHKLVPYWFRMHEAYYADEDDYWNLQNLTDEYDEFDDDSLIDILDGFFDEYSDIDDDDDRKRTFEVNRYESDGDVIEGEIKLGEYGIEADVYDTVEGERIHSHRKEHHSEETPFYFLFYVPSTDKTRAVAVLKQYRARGVMGELFRRLKEYISQYDSDDEDTNDIVCEMKPVYTQDAEERITRADDFKRLKFEGTQELTPVEEHADNEGATDVDRQRVSRTYEIKPTSESRWSPDFVQSFMPDGNWKYGELQKDEFDDVKLEVEEDGSTITFSLWNANIRMRRELDPSNLNMNGGHPTADSLSPKAREVADIVLPPESDGPDDGTIL